MKATRPGEVVEGLGVEQAHGRAEEAGHLGIVTAGVRGARLRVGEGMARDDEPVQLAQQRERRPVAPAPGGIGAHAR